MKNNDFDKLFEELNFDIEEPHTGHKERFSKKLETITELAARLSTKGQEA